MELSIEGFLYPRIDDAQCIHCGVCKRKCPSLSRKNSNLYGQAIKAVWLRESDKLRESTSGGVFSGMAEQILESGGVVFGAEYDDNLEVHQAQVESMSELKKLKGSKYVESDTRDSFSSVREALISGRIVLYSGTPCQIAGLKSFLGDEYNNLITIDLICHGVPSRKLFKKWLEWKEEKTGGRIIYVGFRDKDVGGGDCLNGKLKIRTKTKTKTKTIKSRFDPYYASFVRYETYRESCYTCPYADIHNRPADITIGDFLELDNIKKYETFNFDIKRGVSLVIFNTKKGEEWFMRAGKKFESFSVEEADFINIKGNVKAPSPRPAKRDLIYNKINETSPNNFFNKFHESHLLFPLEFYIKSSFYKMAHIAIQILPRSMAQKIRRTKARHNI